MPSLIPPALPWAVLLLPALTACANDFNALESAIPAGAVRSDAGIADATPPGMDGSLEAELVVDFVRGEWAGELTLQRESTGTAVDAMGVVIDHGPDVPRYDHSAEGEPFGLLIEMRPKTF